jgi:hypothetical protein
MPSFRLEIDGVERDIKLESLSVQHVVNGADVLEGVLQDEDGTAEPDLDYVVELIRTDVSPETTYFKGLLQTANSETWTGEGFGRLRRITAFDFGVYASFITITFTTGNGSPGDTVASFISALVNDYLTDYGVTVHPSQATGPALEANAFDGQTIEAALNAISEQTGWVWKIDSQNKLRMWDPATETAGFNVTETNGTYVGDIRLEKQRNEHYANRVFVEGGNGYRTIIDETHLGDGSKTTFEMNAPMHYFEVDYTSSLGFMVGLTLQVTRSGGTTTEYANDQSTAQWIYNRGPEYSLTQVSGAVLGPAEFLTIPGYAAEYPFRLVADGRGSPPAPARDIRLSRPWMFNRQALQALADQVLAASQGDFERAVYDTDEVDIAPGETQTITVAEAGANDTYTVVSVRLFYVSDGDTSAFRREVTAVNAITAKSFWLNLYSRWLEDNVGGGSATLTGPIGSTVVPQGPAGLHLEVQYNRFGQFGANSTLRRSTSESGLQVGASQTDAGDYNLLSGQGHAVN